MTILVTGGLGFIGSHTCVELISSGRDIVVLDNLSTSSIAVLDRIEKITGRKPPFVNCDIADSAEVARTIQNYGVSAVIHFAAFKAVAEAVSLPLKYYDNNVAGTISLLRCMAEADVKRIVFSSSATVYGAPRSSPVREDFPRSATTAYGRSKIIVEDMLSDLAASDASWRIASLRYFNPVGAHASGWLGEDPKGFPNNLMPYLLQVAIGRRPELSIFGRDYPTRDGTCIRDYVHVVDIADGHLAALDYLNAHDGSLTVNLGVGQGVSVLEVCETFETATGQKVPRRFADRRPGDPAECWSDPGLANSLLGWRAQRDLRAMCKDSWNWQVQNPDGYDRNG